VLIFVFDPLAVALILAYNMAISKEYAIYSTVETPEPKSEPKKEPEPVVKKEENVVTETVPEMSIPQPVVTVSDEAVNVVEKYDTNNDGKIDTEEAKKMSAEELKKMENQGDEFFKRYFTHR
jgi:hypothetical protein